MSHCYNRKLASRLPQRSMKRKSSPDIRWTPQGSKVRTMAFRARGRVLVAHKTGLLLYRNMLLALKYRGSPTWLSLQTYDKACFSIRSYGRTGSSNIPFPLQSCWESQLMNGSVSTGHCSTLCTYALVMYLHV